MDRIDRTGKQSESRAWAFLGLLAASTLLIFAIKAAFEAARVVTTWQLLLTCAGLLLVNALWTVVWWQGMGRSEIAPPKGVRRLADVYGLIFILVVGASFIVDVRAPQQERVRALFDVAWRFQYVVWLVGLSAIPLQSKAIECDMDNPPTARLSVSALPRPSSISSGASRSSARWWASAGRRSSSPGRREPTPPA